MACIEYDLDDIEIANGSRTVLRRDQILAGHSWRTGDVAVQGRPGALVGLATRGVGSLGLRVFISGAESDGSPAAKHRPQFVANVREFQSMCRGYRHDGTVVITRRVVEPEEASGGGDIVTEAEALARVIPESLTPRWNRVGFVDADFDLLDGLFYDTTPTDYSGGSGNIVMPGDDRTEKMTIAFSTAATLTNTTLGRSLTVAEACTVDVWAKTAVDGSMDPIPGTVLYDGPDLSWFALAPGTNALTVSAGTVTIAARAAYL